MTIEKQKYHGDVKHGKRVILKYLLEFPEIKGSKSDEMIAGILNKVKDNVLDWLNVKLKTVMIAEYDNDRKKRLQSETPTYRLVCEARCPEDGLLELVFFAYFGSKVSEHRILLSCNSAVAMGIEEFCTHKDRLKFGGCQFKLGKKDIIVYKKGKMHKIHRI